MIKSILVPIDFSKGSTAALSYAEALASALDISQLDIVHVFTPQVAGSGNALSASPVGELMDARQETMDRFLADHPSATDGLRRRGELLLGFPAAKIVDRSEKYDLVVLGATGESDVVDKVFGNVASEVIAEAKCPVLVVPEDARFVSYRHILYASSNLSLSRRAVLQLMDFNELFRARVHFVHVNDDDSKERREREKLFAPLFNNPDPEFAFEIKEVTADTVQEGLVDYMQANPVELAIMVTEHRGFWQKLFHHSDTKQMLLSPKVPVLVLHLK